ncbi:VOC family protein [Evansella cellulosilytica]|uniref:Glyoxalase/bleomycin resistance protein/dioxygenase n=1 Tax=Evansella cellulosilytica (strain ATCC 21833 / DSM 2522 / FERM P-1141 / JCM 9156 / N-4) TaxID=649639 RepID=E6TWJ5_EVAC2|nr:VOC family protein [Evansella cellulosilytica]ADU32258.1 Glyoxalase/bleomycin resistance protein/dioxygenase [Evansella cellulosilytica DSM 2522]
MIIGLHHAQITIPKGAEEEGRRFYCHILQLPEMEKPDSLKGRGGFWLQVGDKEVHVGTEDGFDRLTTKAHLAYEVEDVPYWRHVLEENKIEILDSVPIPGYERFEFRDPFGNRVEMIKRTD